MIALEGVIVDRGMPGSTEETYAADDARWSALMASAQAGDEDGYRQLLGELVTVVTRYLRSRLGGQEYVDDCVQEVLIAVHNARHSYDPARRFRPWLFAIVRHKAIDALRRQGEQHNSLSASDYLQQAAADERPMEDNVAGGRMIRALSAPHRDAVVLTKIVGLSSAEAASRLAISEGALKVRVHRAVNHLRKMMEAESP